MKKSTEKEFEELLNTFTDLLTDVDESVLDKHRPILRQLAMLNNSYITVFDHRTRQHVLTSYGVNNIFGIEPLFDEKGDNIYYEPGIHPADLNVVTKGGMAMMYFAMSLPDRKMLFDYKLVNEFRILNVKGKYMRVIEQFQVLETDANQNIWLVLSVLDISPDQQNETAMSQVINYRSGEIFTPPVKQEDLPHLSSRELEILSMVKQGFYSKEISDKLSISINTVNTHRQNILSKLSANNSIEAVRYASKLGLV